MRKNRAVKTNRKEGAPAKFSSPEEMGAAIQKYFEACPDKRNVVTQLGTIVEVPTPTMSGLALFLGFCDRHSMYDYEKRPLFSHTIKKARAMLTRVYESNLTGQNCAGSIFMLKNLGYADKHEIESKSEVKTVNEIIVKYENMSNEQLTDAIMDRINGHKAKLN